MGSLIIPKNSADRNTLHEVLRVYYASKDWVPNTELIEKLSSALLRMGYENERKEPQSYTKKTQVLSYFGFLEWEDMTDDQSRRRITESGIAFFEACNKEDEDAIFDILIRALQKCTFGRNVVGCSSDSDIEPPNVFLKASLLLDGISNIEFAEILGFMEYQGMEFHNALCKIKMLRKRNSKIQTSDETRKWADSKPIIALKNWGMFFVENGTNKLNNEIELKYYNEILALKIKNTEETKFRYMSEMNPSDSMEYLDQPLQKVIFGAPGTGKSHKIENTVKQFSDTIRTTFHPDSDYSTFIGCYKPTKSKRKVFGSQGPIKDPISGEEIFEECITYSFVQQAFTKAYVQAWKKWAEADSDDSAEPQFLIIEEINRGNCAQIFGDIFQLLDRDDTGFSSYAIEADTDLAQFLSTEFSSFNPDHTPPRELPENIRNGLQLKFPPNFYIWATMNTSDQSLFPMDSAFKRRWDWEYVPIDAEDLGWMIHTSNQDFPWRSFLATINKIILDTTKSEDKQLGHFFVKTKDKVIEIGKFINKVLFYLFNDVFKDYDLPPQFSRKNGAEKFAFKDFFHENGSPNEATVIELLNNLLCTSSEQSNDQ